METIPVHPVEWAMITGVHPVYNARSRRITPLSENCCMVDTTWKADGPGCEARGDPDIRDRFFVYGNGSSDQNYQSWLKTELFYRVEHLRKVASLQS